MRAPTLMVQGTASHVGKSVVVAALCRALARRGLRVAPFKAQNMSLNSAVTLDGGEIGRSQAFQAEACGIPPEVAMNPILLKPMAGGRCQVIVNGQPYRVVESRGEAEHSRLALAVIAECLTELRSRFDVVVLEGMGSPAEINLRERDLANMRTAALAGAPVLLVGDIERGGVFAALAGTMELLEPGDRQRVVGYLINKFYGDPTVLASGIDALEQRYGVPTVGVLPYLPDLRPAEEDAEALDAAARRCRHSAGLQVVVPRLPGIANFTDLAPLAAEPGVSVRYVTRPTEWGTPALVVLPGTRSTVADLAWLRDAGLERRLLQHAASGGWVVGLCGGYQMLGQAMRDPERVESAEETVAALALLDAVTTFAAEKRLTLVRGTVLVPGLEGLPIEGYEIHHGVTRLGPGARSAVRLSERFGRMVNNPDGAVAAGGRVFGTYLHGLFDSAGFRRPFLRMLGWNEVEIMTAPNVFDRLADWLEEHVRMADVLALIGRSEGKDWRSAGSPGAPPSDRLNS
jgi:cobyric acid synthase CobQ